MTRAFICGCQAFEFSPQEKDFIYQYQPWGLILFGRNVESPKQLTRLCEQFRHYVGRKDAPILVDQEGGRVQRLKQPHWRAYPSAQRLSETGLAGRAREDLVRLSAQLMAHDLLAVGINVDCLPVLDVPAEDAHAVIGERAYGRDPQTVAKLGRAAADGLMQGGVLPVMKHVPGHGRAKVDTHFQLPTVTASRQELERMDWAPFHANRDLPMAMTAHVIYAAIDPQAPATLSEKIVSEVIRGAIGFEGLLMSDDLSMKALSGSFKSRAERMFAAGVDMALHCNGDLSEAVEIAEAAPALQGFAAIRADAALARLSSAGKLDVAEAAQRLQQALQA